MDRVIVVGSGASGVQFAQSLLAKGRRVIMLDVGHKKPEPVRVHDHLNQLKANLKDPVDYFLGRDFESLILPGNDSEYYGFPPSKSYVFEPLSRFQHRATGFSPLVSFASGGLAEAWTGGSYPLNDDELHEFPFSYADLKPYYELVASRIGLCGAEDDLSPFYPFHAGILDPLELDEHSRLLMETYQRKKQTLNQRYRCFFGRSRIATLSRDLDDRKACSYLGRCLWGCPTSSLYTPSVTLNKCLADDNFQYIDQLCVDHFRFDSAGRVRQVVARAIPSGKEETFDTESLVLAAGTLSSSKIFLDSIYRDSGKLSELGGLMDNRQVLMPFVNLRMIGKQWEPQSYQYHQVASALQMDDMFVHSQITTLKTAMVHPIVQTIPGSLRAAIALFRNMHAALGLLNINLHDVRRPTNRLVLELDKDSKQTRLLAEYQPSTSEKAILDRVIKTYRKIMRSLGCVAPARMTHVRPMGASVHYAGTIPMANEADGPTADEHCRCRDFENLYFVDGTTFPSLAAKNLTFTLMANAARVADTAF